MNTGETKAWETLAALEPGEVCRRSGACFDPVANTYTLTAFGSDFRVALTDRSISATAPQGEVLLGKLAYFFRLSILWYLVLAKEIPLTGRLVKPENLKGGQIFFRGSHVLPLDGIAKRYDNDCAGLLEKGTTWGGMPVEHGDAAVRVLAFPRLPVIVLLWRSDEEFPARADLLFDSSCELLLPLDVLWSIAMATLLVLLA